jgi:hypothetical protein
VPLKGHVVRSILGVFALGAIEFQDGLGLAFENTVGSAIFSILAAVHDRVATLQRETATFTFRTAGVAGAPFSECDSVLRENQAHETIARVHRGGLLRAESAIDQRAHRSGGSEEAHPGRKCLEVLRPWARLLHIRFLRPVSTPDGLCKVLFYTPKSSTAAVLLEGRTNLLRMRQEIPLLEGELTPSSIAACRSTG